MITLIFFLVSMPTVADMSAGHTVVIANSEMGLAADNKPYSFAASCQIKCADGQCRVECASGLVYASGDFEAKVQAESILRCQASGKGVVVEGTVSVPVSIKF